jgi:hypothetical protein
VEAVRAATEQEAEAGTVGAAAITVLRGRDGDGDTPLH